MASRFHQIKPIVYLAMPSLLALITRVFSGVIATFMVAYLHNETILAAFALGYTYYSVLYSFCIGILFATGVLVSTCYGALDIQGVTKSCMSGLMMASLLGIMVIIFLKNGHLLFQLFHQDPLVAAGSQEWMNAVCWSVLPWFMCDTLQQFLLGVARPHMLNVFSAIGLALNVALFYLFIFGHWGFTPMGLVGVGYGLSVSGWVVFIVMAAYSYWHPHLQKYWEGSVNFKQQLTVFKNVFTIGWPIGCAMVVETLALMVIVFFIGALNTNALAAYQVVYPWFLLAIMIPVAVGQAATVLIGHQMGKKTLGEIESIAFIAGSFSLCLMLVVSLIFWLFPSTIVALFLDRNLPALQETFQFATTMLMITGIVQLGDALRITFVSALRGIQDVRVALVVNLICFWLMNVPVAAVAAFLFHWGPMYVWASSGIGVYAAAGILMCRFFKRARRLVAIEASSQY